LPLPPPTAAFAGLPLLALALAACVGPEDHGHGISELEANLATEVSTVVELSWTSDLPGDSWVEFEVDGGWPRSTPVVADASGQHSALLLGIPAFSLVSYEVFTDEGDQIASATGEIETGGLPAGLPDLRAMFHDAGAMSPEPYMLVTTIGAESWVVVLDRQGSVLWYLNVTADMPRRLPMASELAPWVPSVRVGSFFMDPVARAKESDPATSLALQVDLQAQDLGAIDLGIAHHDMVTLPDGTIATLGIDVRDWYDPDRDETVPVMGDTIVEVAPDGTRSEVYTVWDWAEPRVHDRFYQMHEDFGDWTHGNGLSYDPATDSYLFSLGGVDTVLQVERGSGTLLRELGSGGYQIQEDATFHYQHDPHWTDDGTLLLSSCVGYESRLMAIEYEVDDNAGELRELWSYGKDEGFTSIAGGQALRLANGNTLMHTGYGGLMVEVTPEGKPVWELGTNMGSAFSDVRLFDDFYAAE
jgi:hypothetical protein